MRRVQRLEANRKPARHGVRIASELIPNGPLDVVTRIGTGTPAFVGRTEQSDDADVMPSIVGVELNCAGGGHFGKIYTNYLNPSR